MSSAERLTVRPTVAGPELARWLIAAVVVVAGIGLFFAYAPRTQPVVQLSVQEGGS